MTRKYWTDDEIKLLHDEFEQWYGLPWDECVARAASLGTASNLAVLPATWGYISAHVGTRTAEQCARRLQTEVRQEMERRAAKSASADPEPLPELSLPFQNPRPWHCPPSAGRLAGLDVSPYIGKAKGRIVLSFNGRGAA